MAKKVDVGENRICGGLGIAIIFAVADIFGAVANLDWFRFLEGEETMC